tara:strand:+ start:416 stop:613 length:198 start_codon:yes stop_codon:yes gene_type:complete
MTKVSPPPNGQPSLPSNFFVLKKNEMNFKDSVKVDRGQTVNFIMRFEDFSDAQTPYMYHCHILEY